MTSPTAPPSLALDAIRGSAIRDLLRITERPGVLSLAGGLPATELIPVDRIADAADRTIGEVTALQYGPSLGVQRCREAIADLSGCDAAQILVTHGSQQALSLVAAALVNPGDTVIVDDPVYVGALQCFQAVRADIVALPITASGTDTAGLESLLRTGVRPRIVHTVSNFHNPSGITASTATREALASLAQEYGFFIIEDDPYGALRFDGVPIDPIPGERVIRLGSTSKILAPALRVGWMQAPPTIIAMIERLRQSADLCGSTLCQLMAADLLSDSGWLAGHVDGLRTEYRRRAESLVESLHRHLGGRIELNAPQGGMFCWARLPGVDTSALLHAAVTEGMAFVPGSAFAVTADFGEHLRLSFATLRPPLIDEGVRRLTAALDHE
ncbi:PLP-dependent aminotransferase family protein [Gordonia sp. DT219]|uniref:aminotransferase-like domain-containing protein n=1 Tax=Gordonia sp. DT219 TaxID=3416658 RepID=UPI003CEEC6C1